MKRLSILLFALILFGCNSEQKQLKDYEKTETQKIKPIGFPTEVTLTEKQAENLKRRKAQHLEELKKYQRENNSVAWCDFEAIEYKVGNVYRAKVFMSSNTFYKKFNVKPIMEFRFEDEAEYPYSNLFVKGDTGYVYFIIYDDTLKVGEVKERKWRVKITLPLPEKDTIFHIIEPFFYTM